jgi:hypothetical protein
MRAVFLVRTMALYAGGQTLTCLRDQWNLPLWVVLIHGLSVHMMAASSRWQYE